VGGEDKILRGELIKVTVDAGSSHDAETAASPPPLLLLLLLLWPDFICDATLLHREGYYATIKRRMTSSLVDVGDLMSYVT